MLTFEGVWNVQSNCPRMKCYCEEWVGGGVIVEHGQHNQSEYGTHLHTGPAPTTARSSYDAIGFLTWNVVSIRIRATDSFTLCPRYSLSFVDLLSLSMGTLTYNFPCCVCIKSKSI